MKKIYFSVVIPTYNRGKYLKDTLEALCNQDNPGCTYEVIPVDNNSTDETAELIEGFAKRSPIPIIYTIESRAGSAYARNTGFKQARGEIIGLIDDDIIVGRTWVREMTTAFRDSGVGAVGGKINLEWINGSPPHWFAPYQEWLGVLDYGDVKRTLNYGEHINAGNYAIRKEVLFEAGGYPPCDAPGDKLIGDGECGLNFSVWHQGKSIEWIPLAEVQHVNNAKGITIKYMRRRSKHHGMGGAYSFYRQDERTKLKTIKTLTVKLIQAANHYFRSLQQKSDIEKTLFHLFKYEYNIWYAIYLVNIMRDSELRSAVMMHNWLD